ncbi:response regulator transcription factor [Enterobacter oligotrophicus]|nr:response regulator transcription factor [Enterobacter oligotrophicus]
MIEKKLRCVNSDFLMVILTENNWLYAGLSALMPEMVCLPLRFSADRLPYIIGDVDRVLVVVDSRIIFRGEWSALNALKAKRPDATVVWLALKETGRVFPVESQGVRVLAQKLDIASLHFALRRTLYNPDSLMGEEYVEGTDLTLTERCLLPYFVSGLQMHVISRLTGKPVKTLYTHRHNILEKMGFRLPVFLQFVHERNQGLPGIPELEHIDVSAPVI